MLCTIILNITRHGEIQTVQQVLHIKGFGYFNFSQRTTASYNRLSQNYYISERVTLFSVQVSIVYAVK